MKDSKQTEKLYSKICDIIEKLKINPENLDKYYNPNSEEVSQLVEKKINDNSDYERRRIMKLIDNFEREAHNQRYSKLLYLYEQLQAYTKEQDELRKEELIQEAKNKIKDASIRISESIEKPNKEEKIEETICEIEDIQTVKPEEDTNYEMTPAIKAYKDNVEFYNKNEQKEQQTEKSKKRESFLRTLYYSVSGKEVIEDNESEKHNSFDQYR